MVKRKEYMDQDIDLNQKGSRRQPMYGDSSRPIQERRAARKRVERVPIDRIVPDARQPRRAIPSEYRRCSEDGLADWITDTAAYIGVSPEILLKGSEIDPPEQVPAYVDGALRLIALARSIRDDGLINPVTVAPDGDRWLLETGERRWMAFKLLHMAYPDGMQDGDTLTHFHEIEALVVDRLDVWRQAKENNQRDDLNAIGMARQLAILLMDLTADKYEYRPLDAFTHECDYYAQALQVDRIPYGRGDDVAAAMGANSQQRVSQYKSLLKLHPAVWTLADDLSVPEGVIRDLSENPGMATREIHQWAEKKQYENHNIVVDSDEDRTVENTKRPAWWDEKRLKKMSTFVQYIRTSAGQPDTDDEIRERLQMLRDEADAMLREMDGG